MVHIKKGNILFKKRRKEMDKRTIVYCVIIEYWILERLNRCSGDVSICNGSPTPE